MFDVDLDQLQFLLLNDVNNPEKQKTKMYHDMQFLMLEKFTVLCRAANIDFMGDFSPALIVLLCSKIYNKGDAVKIVLSNWLQDSTADRLLHRYSSLDDLQSNLTSVTMFDEACLETWDDTQQTCFNTVSDWIYFLEYVSFDEGVNVRLEHNNLVSRMRRSFENSELSKYYTLTTDFIAQAILHVSLNQLPSVKLLERFLARQHTCFIRDIELRVLRTITAYSDHKSDAASDLKDFLQIISEIHMRQDFFVNLGEFLIKQNHNMMQNAIIAEHVPRRLQLRYMTLSKTASKQDVSNTFVSWANNLQLSVVSSKHLQSVLYFVKCQPVNLDLKLLQPYFSDSILSKLHHAPNIVEIDVDAIYSLLCNIRVYLNNIPQLVDFRMSCLKGLSQTHRKSLTLINILQLYICVFQHPSIRLELWKKICPTLNHTTQLCIQQFYDSNKCDYENVLMNLTHNHTCETPASNFSRHTQSQETEATVKTD